MPKIGESTACIAMAKLKAAVSQFAGSSEPLAPQRSDHPPPSPNRTSGAGEFGLAPERVPAVTNQDFVQNMEVVRLAEETERRAMLGAPNITATKNTA